MSSPYYTAFLEDEGPSRSTSAPPALDSKMIFAFTVQNKQTQQSAFSDIRNEQYYQEFYDKYKEQFAMPPPLQGPVRLQKAIQVSSKPQQAGQLGLMVSDIVNNCIKEEQTGQSFTFNVDVAEFAPSFTPYDYYNYQWNFYTQAVDMAKDQLGCRTLQKKIQQGNFYTVSVIFQQVVDYFPQLMTDPFGNYLCQKLLEVSTLQWLQKILHLVLPQLVEISMNQHGTRAIQKLVEVTSWNTLFLQQIVQTLNRSAVILIKDANGNHVIQKCLHCYRPPFNDFIYSRAQEYIIELATHRHGCCVLQRCIDVASHQQREALVDRILQNAVTLVQDAFGNYVVQYILDLESSEINERLAYIFIGNIKLLSTQKFSSNVIQKCLQQNSSCVQMEIINQISKPHNIAVMIADQFANYVVQRALSLAPLELKQAMLETIKSNFESLKNTQVGKRVQNKLIKAYPELLNKQFKQ